MVCCHAGCGGVYSPDYFPSVQVYPGAGDRGKHRPIAEQFRGKKRLHRGTAPGGDRGKMVVDYPDFLPGAAVERRDEEWLHGIFLWVLDNTFFGSADAWGASQSLLGVLGAIPMAIAALFVVPLANRFGKRTITFAGMVVGVIGGVIAGLGNGQIIPVAIGVAMKCLGSAPACYLILAMLADVIDHIEFTSGIRTDGLTMSIYSSIMVAATPVCNAVFSAILRGSGYNQTADAALGTMGQTLSAQRAITVSYIWIETIGYALCGLLMLLWKVEKTLPQEQKAIADRKK